MTRWPNKMRVEGGLVYMDLEDSSGKTVAVTIFDAIDILKVLSNKRKWCLANNGRVVSIRNVDDKELRILLHRVILDPPDDMEIDHINRNPLDNRRENLRVVTTYQNSQNKKARISSKTGVKGVCWTGQSKRKPFTASIYYSNKRHHLGYFASIAEAEEAVRQASLKHLTHTPYHQEQESAS